MLTTFFRYVGDFLDVLNRSPTQFEDQGLPKERDELMWMVKRIEFSDPWSERYA